MNFRADRIASLHIAAHLIRVGGIDGGRYQF